MKRWLLALMMLVLAGCGSLETSQQAQEVNANLSYEEARALAQSPMGLSATALSPYSFDAAVEQGALEGTALSGELTHSEVPASDTSPAYTVLRGTLDVDGAQLDALGIIRNSQAYIFFRSTETRVLLEGRGEVAGDGSVAGSFSLRSGKSGLNRGSWTLKPDAGGPGEPTPDPDPVNPDPTPDPEPDTPETRNLFEVIADTETLSAFIDASSVADADNGGLTGGLPTGIRFNLTRPRDNVGLEDGKTVFVPSNEAFAALGSLPEGDSLDNLLFRHIARGTFTLEDLTNGALPEFNGISVEATDEGVILGGVARIIESDIGASNGVIHIIDAVLQ